MYTVNDPDRSKNGQREKLEEKIAQATGTEKENLEQSLGSVETAIERYEKKQWKLDQEGVDRFRANADKMYVRVFNYAASSQAEDLIRKLLEGGMSVEGFTHELDRRAEMTRKEGL